MKHSSQSTFSNVAAKGAGVAATIAIISCPVPSGVYTDAIICEAKLGAAMLSLARREGHNPAIYSEVVAALADGMTLRTISRCLGLGRYDYPVIAVQNYWASDWLETISDWKPTIYD